MVTGNNSIVTRGEFIDSAIEQLSSKEGELSIFLEGDGLSFSVLHKPSGKIVLLAEYQIDSNPSSVLELLKQFDEPFASYKIGWHSPKTSWIPQALFSEDQLNNLASKTLGEGQFTYTTVEELEAVVIHDFMPESLERVVEAYSNTLVLPDSAIHATAISRLWKTRPGEHLFVDKKENYISVAAISNGKLLLQNTFPIANDEDVLYYILYVYEQLKFHPDEVPMKVSGNLTENHGLWATLSKYIREIDWIESVGKVHPAHAIPVHEIRNNAALTHLHSCGS